MADGSPAVWSRIDAWARWLRVPWSQAAVALALVGGAMAPAILVTAADVWQVAAADDFVARSLDDLDPLKAGVTVVTNSQFQTGAVRTADALITDQLTGIDGLEAPIRTMWTTRESGEVGPDALNPGVPLRVLARPGVIESLDVIAVDPEVEGGAWISEYVAERTGAAPGDLVAYASALEPEEPGAEFAPTDPPSTWPIAGIYRAPWDDPNPTTAAYWADVPPDLVPQFSSVFRAPAFSLVILDEATMADSGLVGFTQWDARSASVPQRIDTMRARVAGYQALETTLVSDDVIDAALDDLAAIRPAEPTVETVLTERTREVEEAVSRLDQPLAAVRTAGVLVGLIVMVSSAAFAVQRRRTEYRLLSGEGERWPKLSIRTAAQLALPVALGTVLGSVLGVVLALVAGPADAMRFDVVEETPLILVAAIGLVAASFTTGVLAQRTLDTGAIGRRSQAVPALVAMLLVGLTVLLWYQVAQVPTDADATIDLTVVLLPLAGLVAAIAVVLVAVGVVATRGRFHGGRLPTPALLAWRRATRNERGSGMVVGALAVGIGLVAMSSMLVSSLDRNVDVRLATAVGAETAAEVVSVPDPEDIPDDTTLIAFDPARLQPGNRPARVVAIDPSTFADVVEWPDEFGLPVDEVVDLLEGDLTDSVPVVAVDNVGVPREGEFGSRRVPYRVVGTIASAPLAYEFGATLLVSAERVDEFARQRLASLLEVPVDDAGLQVRFDPPTNRYRDVWVSQSSATTVAATLEALDVQTREVTSRAVLANDIDVVGARAAFDYLATLGWVAAAAAVAALLLHLAAVRAERSLATLMTRRMGLAPGRSALATALEVVVLALVALATAFVVVPPVVGRLLPRFDPNPGLPPAVGVSVDMPLLLGMIIAATALLAGIVWALEVVSARRTSGEVLRAAG